MNETYKSSLLKEIVHDRFTAPEKALQNSKKLYQESVKSYDYYYASIAKFYEGDAYLSLDDLTKACEPLLEAASLQQAHGYYDYLGKCYNVLGAVFYSQCDYVLSMKYFLNALDIAIDGKDQYTQALIYNNIAAVFLLYNDYSHSRQFFLKALHAKINKSNASETDHYITMRIHMNAGICLSAEGKSKEAKKYLDEVLAEVHDEEFETMQLYICEMGIAIHRQSGEIDNAIKYALRMVKYAEKLCNAETICVTYECIHFLIEQKYYDEAKKFLMIDEAVSRKNQSLQNELRIIEEWIHLYTRLEDVESCHVYYKKYYTLLQQNKGDDREKQLIALENRKMLTRMMNTNRKLLEQKSEFKKKTCIDSLTGLRNRNGLKQLMDSMLHKNRKKQRYINLAIIDIDYFKLINDSYGHLTGDKCIKEIANVICLMETERIYGVRFGGDEFFLIGNNISAKAWENIIQKLQKNIREITVPANGETISLTTSIGVFSHIPSATMEFHDYIHYADLALYQVKQNGRNHYLIYNDHFDPKEIFHEL